MFTYVVPTMWRFEPFANFLVDLTEHPLIGEIIIIDNDRAKRPNHPILNHKKILLLDYGRNIFVNPAWNIGVRDAVNDKICIANDDIIFDLRLLRPVHDSLTTHVGVIGMASAPWDKNIVTGAIEIKTFTSGQNLYGFGQLFFTHKQNWLPIPEGLDITFGDNWVFDNCQWRQLPILLVTNFWYYSPGSVTVKSLAGQALTKFEQERECYKQIILSKGLDPKLWCPEHYKD